MLRHHRGRGLCTWHLTCWSTQRLLCSTSYPLHPFHQGRNIFGRNRKSLSVATDQTFLYTLYSQCFVSITSQCKGRAFHCNIMSTHGHTSYNIQRKQVFRNYCNLDRKFLLQTIWRETRGMSNSWLQRENRGKCVLHLVCQDKAMDKWKDAAGVMPLVERASDYMKMRPVWLWKVMFESTLLCNKKRDQKNPKQNQNYSVSFYGTHDIFWVSQNLWVVLQFNFCSYGLNALPVWAVCVWWHHFISFQRLYKHPQTHTHTHTASVSSAAHSRVKWVCSSVIYTFRVGTFSTASPKTIQPLNSHLNNSSNWLVTDIWRASHFKHIF